MGAMHRLVEILEVEYYRDINAESEASEQRGAARVHVAA